MSKEAMKLARKALKDCHYYMINAGLPNQSLLNEAFTAYMELEAELAKPDFWEGYVPEPVKPAQQEPVAWMNPNGGMLTANYINNFASGLDKEIHNIPLYTSPPAQPVQDNPLDCGVHLGSGKDHAIKHHVSYGPAQPVPDAFEQLMREADKPTQVLQQGVAEYIDALIKGTHEITSVTIRPKRTWVGLTDEEKSELDAEYGDDTLAHLDAIEAKLKEKNT